MNPTASGSCIGNTRKGSLGFFPGPVMFWSTIYNVAPGVCEGPPRPAVSPTTEATIAAPPKLTRPSCVCSSSSCSPVLVGQGFFPGDALPAVQSRRRR